MSVLYKRCKYVELKNYPHARKYPKANSTENIETQFFLISQSGIGIQIKIRP